MRVILRCLRSQAWSQETTLKLATLNKPTTFRFPKLLELVKPEFKRDVYRHLPLRDWGERLKDGAPYFADFLQHYGRVCAAIEDEDVLEKLGRLFWYTVEFGLIRQGGKLKMFGSGIISSHGECTNVLEGRCEVRRFELDTVLNTTVKVDEIHKVLFAIDSFDQMYEALLQAELKFFDASRK